MMTQSTILFVDDHRSFAEGVSNILQKHIVGSEIVLAESAEAALQLLHDGLKPDLIITDLSMPGMSGIDLTKQLKWNYPEIKVLVLSMHNERAIVHTIIDASADGYVLKNASVKEILLAVSDIIAGRTHFGRDVLVSLVNMGKVVDRPKVTHDLSDREIEVLKLIAEELSSDEIAARLQISRRTVDAHRAHILEKTGCKNVVSLLKYAIRHELVRLDG